VKADQEILLRALDEPIEAMHRAKRVVKRPTSGWLKAVRDALGLSSSAVAAKIGVSRQAYSNLELREHKGTVSLESLEKAARALDCDLIYFLLPHQRPGQTFHHLAAWNDPTRRHQQAAEHSMMLEGQGAESAVDEKNLGLGRQIYWLRQNLSLYELVTVNAQKLKEAGASEALFGHLQQLALQAIALSLCKIFEREQPHDLHSIHGVIQVLPQGNIYSDAQRNAAERFGARYGATGPCLSPPEYLLGVLESFLTSHREGFGRLRRFRDILAAHSEFGVELESLPSFEEFEDLYGFAHRFYALVSEEFLDVGPALMSLHVGSGFVRLLRQIGVAQPAPGFAAESDAG
jgi:predicted DNA-binding mobile mystery protein A